MPAPIEMDGWSITVRRGKHSGFVGYASHAATFRTLDTLEHRGPGAKDRAVRDIMIQCQVDDALRKDKP